MIYTLDQIEGWCNAGEVIHASVVLALISVIRDLQKDIESMGAH